MRIAISFKVHSNLSNCHNIWLMHFARFTLISLELSVVSNRFVFSVYARLMQNCILKCKRCKIRLKMFVWLEPCLALPKKRMMLTTEFHDHELVLCKTYPKYIWYSITLPINYLAKPFALQVLIHCHAIKSPTNISHMQKKLIRARLRYLFY